MASNEPVEDLTHAAGDESHTDNMQSAEKLNAIEDDGSSQPSPALTASGDHEDSKTNDKVDENDHDGDDEDDDLEEGELKDDDDDDDDDDDALVNSASSNTRFSIFNNNNGSNSNSSSSNNNNNSNNTGSHSKVSSSGDQRLQNDPNGHNNNSYYGASGDGRGPHHHRPYNRQQNNRRHFSPNHPGMHHHNFPQNQNQYPINNSNNNHHLYGFQPAHDMGVGPHPPVMLPQMNHHPVAGPMPGEMYPGVPPGGMGPMQKVNVRCRFYSKTNNKCTWGDDCRFEHRDDSPEPNEPFDDRLAGPDGGPMRGSGQGPPPMAIHDRVYPPYRHQPYPQPMPPHAYGYGPYEHPSYGPHHSNSPPPLPAHPAPPPHWRQQHSPYATPTSNNPPEPVSPSTLTNSGSTQALHAPSSGNRPPSSLPMSGASVPPAPSSGGAPSPGYSSPSSSSAVYERKHRLAYEVAPWNERGHPSSRYDRGDPPAGYHIGPTRGGYYRSQYGREAYGREPPPHVAGGPYPYHYGYPTNHQPGYRGGSAMGAQGPHYRYQSSSQRNVLPDARRSRSNKRTRDGDSSWSDTGSDDSILGEASSSRSHANKISKRDDYQRTTKQANEIATNKSADMEQVDQGGSGTPPGEPLPEDKERQEMLLNKLREIEDLMAKKKEKQDETL